MSVMGCNMYSKFRFPFQVHLNEGQNFNSMLRHIWCCDTVYIKSQNLIWKACIQIKVWARINPCLILLITHDESPWLHPSMAFALRTAIFWSTHLLPLKLKPPNFWWDHPLEGFFVISQADNPLSAHFWWLGALSKRNSPVSRPLFWAPKILITLSTCLIGVGSVKVTEGW